MKAILMKANEQPVLIETDDTMESQQALVEGYIEAIPVRIGERAYYMIMNEEGKMKKLPFNKYLVRHGRKVDSMVGNVLFTSLNDEKDCTEEDLKQILACIEGDCLLLK